jgi:transcriptional regulator with XRE-family HTH domain
MNAGDLGGEFRALRVAAGRTVASVAVDAGLSVPYIANLENGRGNPTVGALSQLAAALGRQLTVGLTGSTEVDNSKKPAAAVLPASLIRFARTPRFRRMVAAMAAGAGRDPDFTARLMAGLAGLASALDRDLGEADWARLLDALFLVTASPDGE